MAITPPTDSLVRDDAFLSTVDTYVTRRMVPVAAEQTLALGPIFNAGRVPGLDSTKPIIKGLGKQTIIRTPGRRYILPNAFEDSSNTQAFRGLDTLSTNFDDVGTAQEVELAYYTDYAVIPWTDDFVNSGPEAKLNRWQEIVDMVTRTLTSTVETAFWGSALDTGGTQKDIPGIAHYLDPTNTTGTQAGLNRANFTDLRCQTITTGTFATASEGLNEMDTMFTNCSGTNGIDHPTAIYMEADGFNAYKTASRGVYRITDPATAEMDFMMVKYHGIPLMWSGNVTANRIYWVNHNYLKGILPLGGDFDSEEPARPATQKIALHRRLTFAMNWLFSRYDRQGVSTVTSWTTG